MYDSMLCKPLKIVSPSDNIENRSMVIESWRLGPEDLASDTSEYWEGNAKALQTDIDSAKTMLCGNCEYFNNTPEMIREMKSIPDDEFDADGGGRGYCHKFDFVCHNLRTCIGWERKNYYPPVEHHDYV